MSRQATGHSGASTVSGSYDFPSGVFFASAAEGNGSVSARVEATDAFVVNGPAAGTPVGLTARLTISARAHDDCGVPPGPHCLASSVGASIQEATAGIQSFNGSSNRSFALALDLPMVATAGTPFNLLLMVRSETSDTYSNITGTLSFPDLPAGAQVTSCKGYTTSPVSSVPKSWGGLKILYH